MFNCFCNNCEDNQLWVDSGQILCGDLPCTGRSNYLVVDWTGTFLGQVATLISNNNLIGTNEPKCTFSQEMNAYACARTDLAVLAF